MGILGSIIKIGTSLIGGSGSKKASREAEAAQIAGINRGMDTLNNQFSYARDATAPWTTGGASAQDELLRMLGLGDGTDWAAYARSLDPAAQQDYLTNWAGAPGALGDWTPAQYGQFYYTNDLKSKRATDPNYQGADLSGFRYDPLASLENDPVYQSLFKTGVDTTLANASATGGLRTGNANEALARVGVDTKAKVYSDRIAQLLGISQTGLGAVDSVNTLGAANAGAIAQLFSKQGDTQAGGTLQRSAINNNLLNTVATEGGSILESLFGGPAGAVSGAMGGAGGGDIKVTRGGGFF